MLQIGHVEMTQISPSKKACKRRGAWDKYDLIITDADLIRLDYPRELRTYILKRVFEICVLEGLTMAQVEYKSYHYPDTNTTHVRFKSHLA